MSDVTYSGRDNLTIMHAAERYNAALLALVEGAVTGDRIIDFGAGDGLYAMALARKKTSPFCVEPDTSLRKTLVEQGLVAAESLSDLDADNFDFVYSLNVLEHIEKDTEVLKSIRLRLRLDGRLFVFVPAFPILFGPMDRQVGHVRRYRMSELRDKVCAAGFEIEHLCYFDSLGFFAALVHRWVGRSGQISRSSLMLYDRWVFPWSRRLDRLFGSVFGKNVYVVARAI